MMYILTGMQRPPRPLTVLRPIYEWINRVNQKHQEVTKLFATDDRKQLLLSWAQREFARSELRFAGIDYSSANVARLIQSATSQVSAYPDDISRRVATSIADLRALNLAVSTEGTSAALTPDLVRRLHSPLATSLPDFRTGATAGPYKLMAPNPAQIAGSVASICMWGSADSFLELHPVEQAAIIHLRLVEVRPFEEDNDRTARAAASMFTVRAGLPPLIIQQSLSQAYYAAIEEGFKMNTRPMVEALAEALLESLTQMARQ
jgi:Fic family protein